MFRGLSEQRWAVCMYTPLYSNSKESKMMIFPCLVVQCLLGLIMFGGEFLTRFVPEAGVQERMKEHGKGPLWKIKY